jgi:glycosyltransferase involved in cell wall biosynthesis
MNGQIGLIAYGLDRAPGGIARYSKELIAALQKAGVNITILQAGELTHYNRSIPLRGSKRLPGLLTIGQIEVARITQQRRLALVHDPTGCAPLWLTRAWRVVTIHDVIPFIYPETSSRLDWLIYHFWLPVVISRLDSIITVSEQSKSDLVQYLQVKPEKITVIPEAASPIYQPLRQTRIENTLLRLGINFPYILYVGSIEARKNLNTLLEAYDQVRCWSENWKLVIVGAHRWKYSSVFSTLERLQLTSSVYFTGYVAEEDLPILYNGASLFIFPSLYEGFGLPVLEALACGTPVVTSNCASLPEVAGEAAILVDPLDVNAIALAIRQVLEEPDLAVSMRLKGIAQAQQFSWEQTAKRTTEVYERLLNGQLSS